MARPLYPLGKSPRYQLDGSQSLSTGTRGEETGGLAPQAPSLRHQGPAKVEPHISEGNKYAAATIWKAEDTAVSIRCADHVTPFIGRCWY
jgi:hypothetical protein